MSWAGWIFDFYDLILYTFLLIPIGLELGLSNLSLSYVLGTSLAATALGGVVFGVLSDKFGRKSVLQWTIITYSIGSLLCGFVGSFLELLIFRIITGIGVGGEWATGQTFVSETFPAKMRGRYGAYMQTGAPIGVAIASIVGGFLQPMIGWRACFLLSILPALLVIVIRKNLPESDMWSRRKELIANGTISQDERGKLESRVYILISKYRKIFILALILAIFDLSTYWFTYSWLPSYLSEQRGFSFTQSALWILLMQVGGFIGYFSFGFVSDKQGRRPAYSVYSIMWASGLVIVTLLWDRVISYPAILLGCMFLVGLGTGRFGGYGPLFSELFPTSIRNTAMGSAFNLARGVQFFTPVIITLVAQQFGLSGGISIAALFAVLTGVWVWVFPETKGRNLVLL